MPLQSRIRNFTNNTKSVNFEKAKLQDLFSSGLHCHIYSINIHFIPNCLPSCLTVGLQQHVKEQTPTVRRIKLPRKATDSSQNSGPNTTIFNTNTVKSMPFWTRLKVGQNSFTFIKLLVMSSVWEVPGSNVVMHFFFFFLSLQIHQFVTALLLIHVFQKPVALF